MKVPVEVLVVLCVAVGTLPDLTVRPLLEVAAAAVLQQPLPAFSLSIWHGFTTPFIMSLVALGVASPSTPAADGCSPPMIVFP